MADNSESQVSLPPGWDRKYDTRTGKYYYVNHFNKTTTWDDPRFRLRQGSQALPYPIAASVPESIPLQDFTNMRPSPVAARAVSRQETPYSSPVRTSETSLKGDVESAVARISATFPTVSDTHIRALLLKYLKSVFPKADETLLLDVLSNSDNNVQKAAEKLISMGFEKRDTPPPRLTLKQKEEEQQKIEEQKQAVPSPPPRVKSMEEKERMKANLQEKYSSIPERVILIALDSADFDEDRAAQILSIMQEETVADEDTDVPVPSTSEIEVVQPADVTSPIEITTLESSPQRRTPSPRKIEKPETTAQPKRCKGKKEIPKISRGTSTVEEGEYRSQYILKPCGPNREFYRGPNDELLLADYITWNGPNPDMLISGVRKSLAKGPNKSLLQERSYKAKGPNAELRKGPAGLAKGSIYSHLTAAVVPVEEESRGK